jgi:hypothetical protein
VLWAKKDWVWKPSQLIRRNNTQLSHYQTPCKEKPRHFGARAHCVLAIE